jgi:hypothetical protein
MNALINRSPIGPARSILLIGIVALASIACTAAHGGRRAEPTAPIGCPIGRAERLAEGLPPGPQGRVRQRGDGRHRRPVGNGRYKAAS